MNEYQKLLKRIDIIARIYLTKEAKERLDFLKHANIRRYLLIGQYLMSLFEKYGDSPPFRIDVKQFKEIAKRFNPPSRRIGRVVA